MNRVAIGYSSYNKPELINESLPVLYDGDHALFCADGSTDKWALEILDTHSAVTNMYRGVKGGSGPAIVFLLTKMLQSEANYTHIGLCEADVVLEKGWLKPTMALFGKGRSEGLNVGAVSPRCYLDRILVQRDGYAVCHNLGAGIIIFTRRAAELVLNEYRVQKTGENRIVFSQLAGVDIAKYWAFRGSDHFLVADWRWDALLASHGMCSLALTPSPVKMIGQNPSLEDQGLVLSTEPVSALDLPNVFYRYRDRLASITMGEWKVNTTPKFITDPQGLTLYFPHQFESLGGKWSGEWRLKDSPGFGPFAWRGEKGASMYLAILGPCDFYIGGGPEGSQVRITDEGSGFEITPALAPEGQAGTVLTANIPGTVQYRPIKITAMVDGVTLYAVSTRLPQAIYPDVKFSYDTLPPT